MYNIQLSQSVKSLTTITEEITKEVHQPHISFECNPAITIVGDQDLGTVKCHTTRTSQQKGFDEMSVTARKQVNVDQDLGTVKCHTTRTPEQKGFDEMSVTARKQVNVDQDLGTVKCHTSRTPQQMGRREQVDWLSLSSWCLGIVVWLFLAVPWVCLEFLIGVFTDHTVKRHTTRTPQQKGFDEMSVTARNQVNVKVPSDARDARITGSAFLTSRESTRTPQQKGVDEMSVTARNQVNVKVPSDTRDARITGSAFLTSRESTRTLQQKGFDEMSVTARNQVNVKVPSDSCNARITGSAFLTSRESTRTLQQKGFDEMSVTARNQVNVKVQSDTKDAWISGSAFLPSGELILCDHTNKKLKLLDENLQMKESIDVPEYPWDIAVVNQHQVIVTFPRQQYLQFIQVTPSLALGHTVDLGMECWGVTVSRESIYISFLESGEGKIGIYDLTGKKKRIFGPYNGKDGNVLIKRSWYIAVSNDEQIFVSGESSTPTVYCLESSGNVLYTVSNPLFKNCRGISVDENENLLVCDWNSHKVFLITKDGKEVREFLTEKDGLSYPSTVSFRRSDGTLVVGGGYNNNILVFTLK